MKAIVCLAAIGLSVSACQVSPGTHYDIYFDLDLPDEYVDATYTAVDAWTKILDGKLHIDNYFFGHCTQADHSICIHASSHAWIMANGGGDGMIGFASRQLYSDRSDIYIPVSQDLNETPTDKGEVISHELGHAFDLEHTQPGTVMNYDIGGAASLPTCDDADQWMTMHHEFGDWLVWPGNKACPNGGWFHWTGK